MSAPVKTEQPTLPLLIPGTEDLPPGGNWLMSEHSVLLVFPGIPLAAVGVGEYLRAFVVLTDGDRADYALGLLPLMFSFVVGGGFLFARAISRGKDGRA